MSINHNYYGCRSTRQQCERFLTFTIAEIKILVGMMTKLKELFPIEGHYYVHKACNILITICKQQLAQEDVDELTERYGI